MSRWADLPSVTHHIGRDAIAAYVDLSGDHNPLHVDEAYATASPLGALAAHGPVGLQAALESVQRWLGSGPLPAGVCVDVALRGPVLVDDAVSFGADPPQDHAGRVTAPGRVTNQRGEEILQLLISVPRAVAPKPREEA
jgi:acyl dehydratase